MSIRIAMNRRFFLGALSSISAAAMLAGCGLYAEVPAFSGTDASPIISGLSDAGVDADAVRDADLGRPDTRVECVARDEVCDGRDDDCDGFIDNLFESAQIAVGRTHTCASSAAGAVYCWGGNAHGQLGIGSTAARAKVAATPTVMTSNPII